MDEIPGGYFRRHEYQSQTKDINFLTAADAEAITGQPVSYTHLDVYKRQGFMRLPMAGEAVDIPQTTKMVDAFLEAGFNYFDTAHGLSLIHISSAKLAASRLLFTKSN